MPLPSDIMALKEHGFSNQGVKIKSKGVKLHNVFCDGNNVVGGPELGKYLVFLGNL